MNLRAIYEYVNTRHALNGEAAFLVYANQALTEIWGSYDVVLDEVKIRVDTDVFSLPHFVGRVRAIKDIGSDEPHELGTPRRYYGKVGPNPFEFSEIMRSSPVLRDITNASTLTIKRAVAGKAIEVVVVGEGREGFSQREVVQFAVNDKQKETRTSYLRITSLTRNVTDNSDTLVYDAEDNLISMMPMRQRSASFLKIRITDRRFTANVPRYLAVYYKPTMQPLQYLDDAVPDELFAPLSNKILELCTLGASPESQAMAAVYGGKAKGALRNEQSTKDIGQSIPVQLSPAYEIADSRIHRV